MVCVGVRGYVKYGVCVCACVRVCVGGVCGVCGCWMEGGYVGVRFGALG